jgi:hypothetical protein
VDFWAVWLVPARVVEVEGAVASGARWTTDVRGAAGRGAGDGAGLLTGGGRSDVRATVGTGIGIGIGTGAGAVGRESPATRIGCRWTTGAWGAADTGCVPPAGTRRTPRGMGVRPGRSPAGAVVGSRGGDGDGVRDAVTRWTGTGAGAEAARGWTGTAGEGPGTGEFTDAGRTGSASGEDRLTSPDPPGATLAGAPGADGAGPAETGTSDAGGTADELTGPGTTTGAGTGDATARCTTAGRADDAATGPPSAGAAGSGTPSPDRRAPDPSRRTARA